jgi:hypothetical protein
VITFEGERGGYTFDELYDEMRLNEQMAGVFAVICDFNWWTLSQIADKTGYPESSISARLRDFRKPQFNRGVVTMQSRRVSDGSGLWKYRLVLTQTQDTTTTEEAQMGTEMTIHGPVGRTTEWARYPLPPAVHQDLTRFDGYGRYMLPHPVTGKPTSFTRATTVADTIDDFYQLNRWKTRTAVANVVKMIDRAAESDPEAVAAIAVLRDLIEKDPSERGLGRHIDLIDNLMGGAESRELGEAVHDWLGALDLGTVLMHQIPEQFQPYAVAYREALSRAGLIAVPEYVERVILNSRTEETVAGRIDRIYRCVETGELYLGDLKTSKTLDFSALSYSTQFAIYGYAERMLSPDGTSWEPMPELNSEMTLCVHVPSNDPVKSQVVPFDLYFGGEGLIAATALREMRRTAKSRAWGRTTPIPSPSTLRYVEARQAIQAMTNVDEAVAIRAEYTDVWDEHLTEFGASCFRLLTATDEGE